MTASVLAGNDESKDDGENADGKTGKDTGIAGLELAVND
jgi:hypothetical protein